MVRDNLKLFDEMERDYLEPAGASESHWSYLNRSARPAFAYIRELLQEWFDNLEASADKRHRLQTEFRLPDDKKHLSAFFELYLYQLFKKQGFEIEVEPEWDKGRPDFMLTSPQGKKILLEATGAYPPRWFGSAEKQRRVAVDYLNSNMALNDFTLEMEVVTGSRNNLPYKRLLRDVQNWVATLDYCQVVSNISRYADAEFEKYPKIPLNYGDWAIKFIAFPIPESVRSMTDTRPIGIQSHGVHRVDTVSGIKSSIEAKNSRYGEPNISYILALNILDEYLFTPKIAEYSISTALFGEEGTMINRETLEKFPVRKPNGVWFAPDGYRMTRMSGICFFTELTPEMMHDKSALLWHHPFASHPLEPDLFRITQNVLDASHEHYERREGQHPRDLLGIDATKWTI